MLATQGRPRGESVALQNSPARWGPHEIQKLPRQRLLLAGCDYARRLRDGGVIGRRQWVFLVHGGDVTYSLLHLDPALCPNLTLFLLTSVGKALALTLMHNPRLSTHAED